jgi:hypothetical protein
MSVGAQKLRHVEKSRTAEIKSSRSMMTLTTSNGMSVISLSLAWRFIDRDEGGRRGCGAMRRSAR